MSNVANLKKRRGVVRASITRLTKRLRDLEKDATNPITLDLARGLTRKLEGLDADFRTHHHALIDLIDDEGTLQEEQAILDEHDDLKLTCMKCDVQAICCVKVVLTQNIA